MFLLYFTLVLYGRRYCFPSTRVDFELNPTWRNMLWNAVLRLSHTQQNFDAKSVDFNRLAVTSEFRRRPHSILVSSDRKLTNSKHSCFVDPEGNKQNPVLYNPAGSLKHVINYSLPITNSKSNYIILLVSCILFHLIFWGLFLPKLALRRTSIIILLLTDPGW